MIAKSVPALDWKGINTTETYRGHSVTLMVTYNSGFIGIGSYYSSTVIIDNEFFVGQFRLPTINLRADKKRNIDKKSDVPNKIGQVNTK